jgi:hypothetical protein
MDCGRYKNWLGDAALGGLDALRQAELRAHLATCSECGADFERERLLLQAIDRGIEADLKTELSPEFWARLRMRLAGETARSQPGFGWWIPATAGALAVLVLGVIWLLRGPAPRRERPALSQAARVAPPSTGRTQTWPSELPRQKRASKPSASQRPASRNQKGRAASAEPQVLVEEGQWTAVMELYNAVWSGRVNGFSLPAKSAPTELEARKVLEPAPLKITLLEVASLDAGSEPPQGSASP